MTEEGQALLARYAALSASVAELGCGSLEPGSSTRAILKGRPVRIFACDISQSPHLETFEKDAQEAGVAFAFWKGDALDAPIPVVDTIYIDDEHTRDHLLMELLKFEGRVRRWIIVHDAELLDVDHAVNFFLADHRAWNVKERLDQPTAFVVLERTNV